MATKSDAVKTLARMIYKNSGAVSALYDLMKTGRRALAELTACVLDMRLEEGHCTCGGRIVPCMPKDQSRTYAYECLECGAIYETDEELVEAMK